MNTRTGVLFTFLCSLMLLPFTASAVEVKGLYQAEVPVKTQEFNERIQVYPAAMEQVVVKLSGDRAVVKAPQLADFIANARQLVQQFQYKELPEKGYLKLKEEGYKRLLVVQFDSRGVNQALVEAGIPMWARTRPEVLMWLAIEDRETRYLLAANASEELELYMDDYSQRRGLPMLLPLMDLEDQIQVTFADVWGDFRQSITAASKRYNVGAILVGRLYRQSDGQWQARWSLYQGNEPAQYWEGNSLNQEEAIGLGIEGAADQIAQRYAQVLAPKGQGGAIILRVTDVNDLAGYARAKKYLESLDVVSRVEVSRVMADEILFSLDIRGEPRGLEQAIALGNVLRDAGSQQMSDATGKAFIYQLLP